MPSIESEADARRWRPFVVFATIGIALSVAFFPLFFNRVASFDDEGALAVTIRHFMAHGSLYADTHGAYGPFYYSFEALLYRVTGQTPTLFNGRVLVLILTAVAAGFFGAAVWRITRSLLFGALCEIATYSLLVVVAGTEGLHPGPLITVFLAVMMYALSCYVMRPRTVHVVVVGVVIGAITMTKANVGLFAVMALVVAFVIGNRQYARRWRVVVGVAALLLPFLVMHSLIWQLEKAQLATLVSIALLAAFVPWSVDETLLPPRALLTAGGAAIVTMLASLVWPLATGSRLGEIFAGVLLRPEVQTKIHTGAVLVAGVPWLPVVLTAAAAYLVLARAKDAKLAWLEHSWLPNAGLAIAALSVLGQAMAARQTVAAWLPAVAILPALAWISGAPPQIRLALRLFVAIAILQMLHAYPVSGAQTFWGTAPVVVPCAIALAAALARQRTWRRLDPWVRRGAVGAITFVLVVGSGIWPLTAWHEYGDEVSLGLPGSRLVRLEPGTAENLQKLTKVLTRRCDTFYSAPAFNSLYILTGLPTPTGLLANFPGALSTKEQRQLASELADLQEKGRRVCIVREVKNQKEWKASYGAGPLGRSLAGYQAQVARIGRYSVSVFGPPRRAATGDKAARLTRATGVAGRGAFRDARSARGSSPATTARALDQRDGRAAQTR